MSREKSTRAQSGEISGCTAEQFTRKASIGLMEMPDPPELRWKPELAKHREMLLGYAQAQLLGSGLDADDFVQETFARYLRAFADRPAPVCPQAYLMKVLQSLLCTEFKKRNMRKRYETDPVFRALLASTSNEAELLPVTRMSAILEEVTDEAFAQEVRCLRPKLRESYELHLQGLSNPEIAARLGVNLGVVAKRLCYARKDLREALRRAAKELES
jgi:RNA polymerase sigma factor (sigma-70 family)